MTQRKTPDQLQQALNEARAARDAVLEAAPQGQYPVQGPAILAAEQEVWRAAQRIAVEYVLGKLRTEVRSLDCTRGWVGRPFLRPTRHTKLSIAVEAFERLLAEHDVPGLDRATCEVYSGVPALPLLRDEVRAARARGESQRCHPGGLVGSLGGNGSFPAV